MKKGVKMWKGGGVSKSREPRGGSRPQSNSDDPGTSHVSGCWWAGGSRRRGRHLGTEEERWGGACRGRARSAARRSGRVAGGDVGEELERREQERKKITH